MSKKKQFFTAISLVFVFMFFSFSPALSAEVQAAYNKIPESLISAFNETKSDEKLTLLVELNDNSTERYQYMASRLTEPVTDAIASKSSGETETNKLLRSEAIENTQDYIMQKRHIAEAIYLENNNAVAKELAESGAEIVYISKYSPLVICKSTFSETIEMAKNDTVTFLKQSEKYDSVYMDVSTEAVGLEALDSLPIDGEAADVKVGVLEIDSPNLSLPCFDNLITAQKVTCFDPGVDYSIYSNALRGYNIAHASYVVSILTNVTNGTARNFKHLYCAVGNDESTKIESIEWMISNGVNVISNSTGVATNPYEFDEQNQYDNEVGYFAKWLDHISYNHSVHYVAAMGNLGNAYVSNTSMAYNVISVGNINDHNTVSVSDDELYYTSSFNAVPDTQCALKPDICAPGVNIDIPGVAGFYYNANGNTKNIEETAGTSFSTPHVAGIVATLCSRNPTLLTKQALMKSILSASVSQKTQHRYDTSDVMDNITGYRRYGSGIVNAYNAQQLIENGNYINTRISASATNATHSIGTIQAGETISISLAFLKRVRFRTSTHSSDGNMSESDLPIINIHIRAASMPAHIMHLKSTETNGGTVQKLIFTADTTDEYQIIVTKSGGDSIYETLYALSWLKDEADLQ